MNERSRRNSLDDFREHLRRAIHAWRQGCESLVTDEFVEKGKEGQKEALLALRSLIDFALEKLDDDSPPDAGAGQKVKVQPD